MLCNELLRGSSCYTLSVYHCFCLEPLIVNQTTVGRKAVLILFLVNVCNVFVCVCVCGGVLYKFCLTICPGGGICWILGKQMATCGSLIYTAMRFVLISKIATLTDCPITKLQTQPNPCTPNFPTLTIFPSTTEFVPKSASVLPFCWRENDGKSLRFEMSTTSLIYLFQPRTSPIKT